MTAANYLRQTLDRAAGLNAHLARIESAENREAMILRHGTTSIYPAMFGELSAVTQFAAADIAHAIRQIEQVDRLERIAAAFEGLDIDLSDENLKALELLASERRYRYEKATFSSAFETAIKYVQNYEREMEADNAAESLDAAGFVHGDTEDYWDKDDLRVTIESKSICGVTVYSWELQSNLSGEQVTVDSGKSGEFSRLIAAISPAVQEVKA